MFKDIQSWSNKKLFWAHLIVGLVYIGFMLIAPVITVSCKYELFITSEKVGKLSGFGILIVIIIGIVGIRALKNVVSNLPETTYGKMWFKVAMTTVYSLMLPILAVIVMGCFKDDFATAYETMKLVLIFFICGILVDKLVLSWIERERRLRNAGEEADEIDARRPSNRS